MSESREDHFPRDGEAVPAVLWLVRHGAIDAAFGVCVGWTNLPLTDPDGALPHAHDCAALIGPADAVYTSDLTRCVQTAQPLAAVLNAPLHLQPELRELNFGRWEMRTWTEIERDEPTDYQAFMADWRGQRAPGGESYNDMRLRVERVWAAIKAAHPGGAVVVVGHGGSLRLLASIALGLPDGEAMMAPLERGHCARLNPATGDAEWNIDASGRDRSTVASPLRRSERGLLIVYTGDGKGKTTAALGTALRALGRGWRVAVVQFIKGPWSTGESLFAQTTPGIEFVAMGRGFTWESENLEKDQAAARETWERARASIDSGEYPLVILDEITYPINFRFLDGAEVLAAISRRPTHVHVIVTGRDAPAPLVEMADLVTEMKEVKHPFQAGFAAVPGIDF